MQDLSGFSVPKGFQQQTLLKCNYGGQYGNNINLSSHKYCIAGLFYYVIRSKIRKT